MMVGIVHLHRDKGPALLLSALAFVLLATALHAQKEGQERIDSLRAVVATVQEGTDKVDALNDLAKFGGMMVGELDTALHHAEAAMRMAGKIGYRKGLADAYHNRGYYNNSTGNYKAALDDYGNALIIYQEIVDERGMARTHNTLGNVHADMGNFPDALTNYFAALKLFEKLNDRRGIGNAYNNMGLVYSAQGSFEEALQNLTDGLRISKETGFKLGIGNGYTNIGNLYLGHGDLPEALLNYTAGLKVKEELGDKAGIAILHSNMGIIHKEQGNMQAALRNFHEALELFEEVGHRPGMANSYGVIGSIHTIMGHAAEGRRWLERALEAALEMGDHNSIMYSYQDLARADSALADFRSAFAHYKLHVQYRDSLINEENTRHTVQLQMQYEFDKKEAETRAEQDKKDALAKAELRKQKVIRNSVGGVLLVIVAFSTVVYRQRNKIGREKKRSEELLLNILPAAVAEELKEKGEAEARLIDQVTVLFTDFKGFTAMSEQVSPRDLVKDLNECFSAFDRIMEKHGMEKIKTIGDAYMAAGGLPTPNSTHAIDAIRAALEMRDFIEEGKARKIALGLPYFEIRIGIHTGPVVAGIVGIKKFQYDIWGDTVNTASRMESSGEVGMVNISEATYALVKEKAGSLFDFTPRGKVEAKGKGELEMYFVRRSSERAQEDTNEST